MGRLWILGVLLVATFALPSASAVAVTTCDTVLGADYSIVSMRGGAPRPLAPDRERATTATSVRGGECGLHAPTLVPCLGYDLSWANPPPGAPPVRVQKDRVLGQACSFPTLTLAYEARTGEANGTFVLDVDGDALAGDVFDALDGNVERGVVTVHSGPRDERALTNSPRPAFPSVRVTVGFAASWGPEGCAQAAGFAWVRIGDQLTGLAAPPGFLAPLCDAEVADVLVPIRSLLALTERGAPEAAGAIAVAQRALAQHGPVPVHAPDRMEERDGVRDVDGIEAMGEATLDALGPGNLLAAQSKACAEGVCVDTSRQLGAPDVARVQSLPSSPQGALLTTAPEEAAMGAMRASDATPERNEATLAPTVVREAAIPAPREGGAPALAGFEAMDVPSNPVTALAGAALGAAALLLAALYQRLGRPAALKNPVRQALYDAVQARGAATTVEAARAVGCPRKSAEYHLDYLVRLGLLRLDGTPARRLYAAPTAPAPKPAEPLTERLLALVRGRPGISTTEIATEMGVSRTRADRAVKELAIEGRIASTVDGGVRRIQVAGS